MIRWRFILTRLMIVAAVIVALRWGLGPVAQYVTTRGLQRVTGAKVNIQQTTVGLFPPRLEYRHVRIADPRRGKPFRDAVTADSIELAIDSDALLRRRLVVRDGRITGLKIGGIRTTSGHLSATSEATQLDQGPSVLSRLLSATTELAAEEAELMLGDLEILRRSNQVRRRWEQEYAELTSRAKAVESEIRTIRDRVGGIDNPLRDWPQFEQTLATARDARNELLAIHQELNALPEQLQADLILLEEAKQSDLAEIDQLLPDDPADTSDFGIDMLSSVVRDQIRQVRSMLDAGREIARYTVASPEALRKRGRVYDLNRIDHPIALVRRCKLSGTLRAGGDLYSISGVVENATATPERLSEPTRTRLRLEGTETIRVEYSCDRRGGRDTDLLTVHWPGAEAESLQLGDPDEAAIVIDGGLRELWVQLSAEGDQIDGRLISKHTGVSLDLQTESKSARSAAVASLRESLADVDRIEIDARLRGTWQETELSLHSNLGQIMRRAARDAVDGQMEQTRTLLIAKINRIHARETIQLRSWLGRQHSAATALLTGADQSIEAMSAKVLGEVGEADRYIGRLRGAMQGRLR